MFFERRDIFTSYVRNRAVLFGTSVTCSFCPLRLTFCTNLVHVRISIVTCHLNIGAITDSHSNQVYTSNVMSGLLSYIYLSFINVRSQYILYLQFYIIFSVVQLQRRNEVFIKLLFNTLS